MSNNNDLSIREHIKKDFGIDLPISGGDGNSRDNPVVIDSSCKDWSALEYEYVGIIYKAIGKSWKLNTQYLIEHKGRNLDQLKIEVEGDDKNYRNFYFDITEHME